jgi:hypothetical protein
MSDTEENATSEAAMTMSTPKQETLLASSSVKTYKASAKSKRGNGPIRKFLEEDGELDAEDVMVVGKLLAKLGFFKKEDLRMLGEAFFESMMPDTPPVAVFKLWNALHHNGHLDEDRCLPAPSCRLATKHLRNGVPDTTKASSTADP